MTCNRERELLTKMKVGAILHFLAEMDVRRVKYAFSEGVVDCPDCGEPYCEDCKEHYADCQCPGPNSEGWEFFTVAGVGFAARISPEGEQDV